MKNTELKLVPCCVLCVGLYIYLAWLQLDYTEYLDIISKHRAQD